MNLANLIDKCDKLDSNSIIRLSENAKNRIRAEYTWEKIVSEYEKNLGWKINENENISSDGYV